MPNEPACWWALSISQAALRLWNSTHIRLERPDDDMRVIEPLEL